MNEKYLTSECSKYFRMANILKNKEKILRYIVSDAIFDEVYNEEVCPERYGFKYPYLTAIIYEYGIDYVLNVIKESGHREDIIEKLIDASKTANKEIKELKDFAKELYKMANEVNC